MNDASEYLANCIALQVNQETRKIVQKSINDCFSNDSVSAKLRINLGNMKPYISVYMPYVDDSIEIENFSIDEDIHMPVKAEYLAQVEESQQIINAYKAFSDIIMGIANSAQARLDEIVSMR
jgi:hypothetical protein